MSPPKQQQKDFNVLAREKYNEKNFQEFRQLRQKRMNGIIQMLQNPFPQQKQLKQEQKNVLNKKQTMLIQEAKPLTQYVSRFKILRIKLTQFLKKLKKINLTPKSFLQDLSIDQFQQVLYKPNKSKEIFEEYFQLIKLDDVGELQLMLNKNPYLVYSYDHAHLSGLHWAAKRGFVEIAKLLIQFNADVDSKDFVKRTPLYLAVEFNNINIIQLLLFHQADPWSTEFINYKDIITSQQVRQLFALSRKIHILLQITPANQREAIWNKEAPAMSIIRNLSVQNNKRTYQVVDVSLKYPTLDYRLQDLNNILQKREKKIDIHKHQQDIEKKVERDIKCFSILNTQNASLQNQYQ
ncbi:SMC5-SMC6 complex localization factor protein 1 [Paramecium bursaria]